MSRINSLFGLLALIGALVVVSSAPASAEFFSCNERPRPGPLQLQRHAGRDTSAANAATARRATAAATAALIPRTRGIASMRPITATRVIGMAASGCYVARDGWSARWREWHSALVWRWPACCWPAVCRRRRPRTRTGDPPVRRPAPAADHHPPAPPPAQPQRHAPLPAWLAQRISPERHGDHAADALLVGRLSRLRRAVCISEEFYGIVRYLRGLGAAEERPCRS